MCVCTVIKKKKKSPHWDLEAHLPLTLKLPWTPVAVQMPGLSYLICKMGVKGSVLCTQGPWHGECALCLEWYTPLHYVALSHCALSLTVCQRKCTYPQVSDTVVPSLSWGGQCSITRSRVRPRSPEKPDLNNSS